MAVALVEYSHEAITLIAHAQPVPCAPAIAFLSRALGGDTSQIRWSRMQIKAAILELVRWNSHSADGLGANNPHNWPYYVDPFMREDNWLVIGINMDLSALQIR